MPSPRKPRPVPVGCDPNDPHRVLLGPEVEFTTGLPWASFKRKYPQFIVRLSDRVHGVQLGNVRKVAAGRA
jgi:hypothetical protein